MMALLDRGAGELRRGSRLPPAWHWLYFKPLNRQSDLGEDGHPRRGGFLPPVELPRRMWAGGRLRFVRPLHLGDAVQRVSTIGDVAEKEGRTGRLIFVKVVHVISGPAGPACEEEQDLVYREAPRSAGQNAAVERLAERTQWREEFRADSVALFRFSALTFNGHRIHYDRPYAMAEGYPDIVVHGPLLALLLLDAACRNARGREPAAFEYRAVSPLFSGEPILLQGGETDRAHAQLWATSQSGGIALKATIQWQD
jgi:3-methylfumaryl-CoA hydratase